MASKTKKDLGRYIVADPKICHGKPTFRGTRIMVWQVLRQVARGQSWDKISADWRGDVSEEPIAEALELAARIFEDYAKNPPPVLMDSKTKAKPTGNRK